MSMVIKNKYPLQTSLLATTVKLSYSEQGALHTINKQNKRPKQYERTFQQLLFCVFVFWDQRESKKSDSLQTCIYKSTTEWDKKFVEYFSMKAHLMLVNYSSVTIT